VSLKDQLLRAGLGDRRRAEEIEREKRREAKVAAGNQASRAERERREAEGRAAEEASRAAELVARRQQAEARKEAERVRTQAQHLLRAHRVSWRPGPQRFWHRSPDGREIWRLDLPEFLATDLRVGRMAIAWVDDQNPQVLLVDPQTADRVAALRPELILFRNRGPIDRADDQQLYEDGDR
jgi:uncharacterized protein YaiL (DUF2058 family)